MIEQKMEPERIYEELSSKVVDHVSAMLAYWDKDLLCRFANAAYLEWFGKDKEDMIGKITIKELLGPLYEKNLPYINGALNGIPQTFEREIPLPSGKIKHSLANYHPDIVDGEVQGFFVHVADVTPLKVLEKELIKSNKTITEQNKRLLNFSNVVSHNLKSYSQNLSGLIELYNSAESEDEKNQMMRYLKRIADGFSSTLSHLNEIVKLQNEVRISAVEVNLCDYIEKARETLLMQIDKSKAVVVNHVGKDVWVMGIPAYMESILLNFLSNAIKYRSPGKIAMIRLDSFEAEGKTALTIADNGMGINLEKYGNDLIGMYKTFHGNKDAQGIGLFITKYQIEIMDGKVEVASEEGKGTTFTIYFNSI